MRCDEDFADVMIVTTAAQAAGSATASGAGGGKDGFRGAGSLVAFVGVFVSAMLVL